MALVFDGSQRPAWWNNPGVAGRTTTVTTPAPPGGTGVSDSTSFEIRDGERNTGDSTNQERIELSVDDSDQSEAFDYRYTIGTPYWVDFYVRFASTWLATSTSWNIFYQVHLQGGGTQPIIILNTTPTNLLELRTSNGGGTTTRWTHAWAPDTWYHFQLHFVLSRTTSDGLLEMKLDGVQQNLSGQVTLPVATIPASTATYPSTFKPYQKIGIYRAAGSFSNTTKVFHHAFKIYDAEPDPGAGGGGGGGSSATPTVTAAPDSTRFGNTSGTAWTEVTANSKRGSDFTLSTNGTITNVRCWMDGGGTGSGTQALKAVVYNAGDAIVVGSSNEATITSADTEGWKNFTFTSELNCAAGTYRLGILSSTTAKVARYAHTTVASALFYGTDTYSDGADTVWGASGVDSKQMTIYAAYTAIAPPTTPPVSGGGSLSATRSCSGSRAISGSRSI